MTFISDLVQGFVGFAVLNPVIGQYVSTITINWETLFAILPFFFLKLVGVLSVYGFVFWILPVAFYTEFYDCANPSISFLKYVRNYHFVFISVILILYGSYRWYSWADDYLTMNPNKNIIERIEK